MVTVEFIITTIRARVAEGSEPNRENIRVDACPRNELPKVMVHRTNDHEDFYTYYSKLPVLQFVLAVSFIFIRYIESQCCL